MTRFLPSESVFVVTRPDKTDVSDYVAAAGHSLVLGDPASVAASLRLGLRAADEERGPNPDRIVLLGFPDTLFRPADAYDRLVEQLMQSPSAQVVLGLFHFDDALRADVVDLAGTRVTAVRPKPKDTASDLVWGIATARAGALSGLADVTEPGVLFHQLAGEGRVDGIDLGHDYIDIGVPDVLRQVLREPPAW